MNKLVAAAAVLVVAPCLEAADKPHACRGLTEDGATTIVEQSYEGTKYLDCVAAVKARVAEAKCTPGLKRFKFLMQRDDAKPYAYAVDCGAPAAPAPPAAAAAPAPPATEAPLLGTGDRRCKALSEDGATVLVTAAYKAGEYDDCVKLVKKHLAENQCTGTVKRFKYQMQRENETPYPSAIACPVKE
jgi:hypothetical protein